MHKPKSKINCVWPLRMIPWTFSHSHLTKRYYKIKSNPFTMETL